MSGSIRRSNRAGSTKGGAPQMLDVPDGGEKSIKSLLKQTGSKGNYHKGLLAALKSAKNKRSSKNAYILLLGQTGAGKSSAINFLFENHEITKTGDTGSETSDILEFAASVPIPELGVQNTEIRVIDTPGLGDTRGLENDAKFLASLSTYLKNHDDLANAVPNVVLIVGKFDDNRLDGPASGFARMLKGVKLLEDQLIDKRFSNIIIVLTHYMNGKKDLRKNPMPRYELVARLVQDVGFPQPANIVGAENEAEEKELEEMNGYFKLPNGEYYPYNIFRRIQQISTENDPMGEAIIRTAFTEPSFLNVRTRKVMKLCGHENPLYVKIVSSLMEGLFEIQPTPISNKLADVWENALHPELRKNYTGSLNIVQNIFQVRQINEFNQLPRNPEDIINFLKEIPQNKAILALLEKALGMAIPELNIAYLVGQGYDVLKDHPASSPFQFTTFKSSPLGYKIPVGVKCELVNETEDICVFNESKQDYTTRRLTDLNLPSTEISMLSGQVKAGYNVVQQMKANNNNEYTTVREHRVFQLTLEDPPFSPAFIKELEKLPRFSNDVHIKQIWKAFFDRYGTHVVNSAYGGGSIETYIQENQVQTLLEKVGGDFSKVMGNLTSFDRDLKAGQSTRGMTLNSRLGITTVLLYLPLFIQNLLDGDTVQAIGVKFRGGNMKYHKSDLSSLNNDEAAAALENWRTSLCLEPIMLDTKLKLMPLSYHVRKCMSSVANEMEVACRALFDNSFNFVPIENTPLPPKRLDIRSLAEFDRSSCLKAGTQILMADRTTKPVEAIRADNVVLDKDLNPCTVLGCNSFFLGDRHFYGFTPNSSFFTEVHLFVSPDLKYNVVSKEAFLEENPAFEMLADQVVSMRESTEFEILRYNASNDEVEPFACHLYKSERNEESEEYFSPETPVYFLEVDSPSGTYFANGYLCRHELPPFHLWPNTFDHLQKMLFNEHILKEICQLKLSNAIYHELSLLAKDISSSIHEGLLNHSYVVDLSKEENPPSHSHELLGTEIVQENLKLVLENQSLVAFCLLIYSKCGKILYNYLDQPSNSDAIAGKRMTVNVDLIQNLIKEKIELFLSLINLEE